MTENFSIYTMFDTIGNTHAIRVLTDAPQEAHERAIRDLAYSVAKVGVVRTNNPYKPLLNLQPPHPLAKSTYCCRPGWSVGSRSRQNFPVRS